jgi:hypothetical protein
MTRDVLTVPQSLAVMELFFDLPTSALETIAAAAHMRRLPKDVLIFNQGDDGVRAHGVVEGGVRIAQSSSDGAQVVVRFIGPGEGKHNSRAIGLFSFSIYTKKQFITRRASVSYSQEPCRPAGHAYHVGRGWNEPF